MKYKLFSIFDSVAGIYGVPFVQNTEDTAIRYFDYIVKNQKMILPQHLELFWLGYFDDSNSKIDILETKEFIKVGDINEKKDK